MGVKIPAYGQCLVECEQGRNNHRINGQGFNHCDNCHSRGFLQLNSKSIREFEGFYKIEKL